MTERIAKLPQQGLSKRQFLKFGTLIAATTGLVAYNLDRYIFENQPHNPLNPADVYPELQGSVPKGHQLIETPREKIHYYTYTNLSFDPKYIAALYIFSGQLASNYPKFPYDYAGESFEFKFTPEDFYNKEGLLLIVPEGLPLSKNLPESHAVINPPAYTLKTPEGHFLTIIRDPGNKVPKNYAHFTGNNITAFINFVLINETCHPKVRGWTNAHIGQGLADEVACGSLAIAAMQKSLGGGYEKYTDFARSNWFDFPGLKASPRVYPVILPEEIYNQIPLLNINIPY